MGIDIILNLLAASAMCAYVLMGFLVIKYSREKIFKAGDGRRISFSAIQIEISLATGKDEIAKFFLLKYVYIVFLILFYASILCFILNLIKLRA